MIDTMVHATSAAMPNIGNAQCNNTEFSEHVNMSNSCALIVVLRDVSRASFQLVANITKWIPSALITAGVALKNQVMMSL